MNRPMDAERILDVFLAPTADRLPERVIDAAFAEIDRIPQRRPLRMPWWPPAQQLGRLATAALVAVVALGGLLYVVNTSIPPGGEPSASALDGSAAPSDATSSPTVEPEASDDSSFEPVASPEPTPTPAPTVIETPRPTSGLDDWTSYGSAVYSYFAAYPTSWTVEHLATRKWDAETDGLDPASRGVDTFTNPAGTVSVSQWQAPHDPEDNPGDPQKMLAWVEELCGIVGDTNCAGIADRAVLTCERACNGPIFVSYGDHVMAFFVGTTDDTINIITVWRREKAPVLDEYGGATNLLNEFVTARI